MKSKISVKRFGGLVVVNNVGFSVEEGEIFGLIGPNSSGKTTIFNLINNFYPLTSGEIYFQGQQIDGLPTHKISSWVLAEPFRW